MRFQLELRIVRIAGLSMQFLGFFLLLIAVILKEGIIAMVLGILGLIIFIAACIFFLIFWRCHWCYRWLPYQGIYSMQCCPFCGTDLEL